MSDNETTTGTNASELQSAVVNQALTSVENGNGNGAIADTGANNLKDDSNIKATEILSALPFGVLLGAPLTAAVEAQTRASMSTLNFILTALYGKETINQVSDGNISNKALTVGGDEFAIKEKTKNEVVYVKFTYTTIDGTESIEVPLISILPIPNFQVDTLDVDFNVKIATVSCENKTNDSKVNYNGVTEASAWWGRFKVDTGITSNQTVHSDTTESINANYEMNVRMRASNRGMPAGLSKVLGMLEDSIHSKKAATAEELDKKKADKKAEDTKKAEEDKKVKPAT